MKLVSLTRNYFALVDDEDYDRVMIFNWYAVKRGKTVYAQRSMFGESPLYMHRFVLNVSSELDVDHINKDGRDNRKQNLRVVSAAQNSFNTGLRVHNKSGFKGVSWNKRLNKWVACIKNIHIGLFDKKEAAASAYDDKVREFVGTYGRYNFPKEGELSVFDEPKDAFHNKAFEANHRLAVNNTSGFKGVYRRGDKWRANIKLNGRSKDLGSYETPEKAALAYDKAAREAFGSAARLNFPNFGEYGVKD